MTRRLTDNERIWAQLCKPPYKLHSFTIRQHLHSGNPSQRIAELEEIHNCVIPRERKRRNGRTGTVYYHPNHPPAGSGGSPSPGEVAGPSGTPPPPVEAGDVDERLGGEDASSAAVPVRPLVDVADLDPDPDPDRVVEAIWDYRGPLGPKHWVVKADGTLERDPDDERFARPAAFERGYAA
jgi:hypothetical protein